jgi:hypothetical protein
MTFNPSPEELAKMPKWYRDAYQESLEDAAAEAEEINENTARLQRVEGILNRVRVTLTAGI